MLAPVNRSQSPISMTNANPVNVEIPRRLAAQPGHHRRELAAGGHHQDLLTQTPVL